MISIIVIIIINYYHFNEGPDYLTNPKTKLAL